MLEINNLYNMDCVEGMKQIPNEYIDLIVTDPPYMTNYKSNRRVKNEKFDHIQNDKNSNELISEFLAEAHRVLKNNTAIYMFCSWHHIDFFKQEFEKYFTLKNLIVWNKNNHGSGDLKGAYAPKHELILYGHKGRSLFREKRIPDVIDCAKIPSLKLTHPAEKPIDLLDIFIRNSSDKGDIILDGFAGTGATCISAINNERKYIGFELDTNYYEIAQNRIAEVLKFQH